MNDTMEHPLQTSPDTCIQSILKHITELQVVADEIASEVNRKNTAIFDEEDLNKTGSEVLCGQVNEIHNALSAMMLVLNKAATFISKI